MALQRSVVAGPKRRVYEILEANAGGDRVAHLVSVGIIGLIVINVAAVVLETVPQLRGSYERLFVAIELVTVALFAVEYILRVWVADLHGPLIKYGPIGARLRYMAHPGAIIDFLAIAPTLVGFIFDVFDVNVLVIFRLLRFLKLTRYSPGMRSLANAVVSERRALVASAVVMAGLIVTAASLMHWIEGQIQPNVFGSIPASMYWAVTTLTTVGYGDVVPVTAPGKVLAGIVMLFGFCMFALPVGIIATAFAREIHQRDFVVTWGMVARVPLFAELNAGEIAEVTRLLSAQSVEPGTVITYAGDPAHCMYFIASGTVEVDLQDAKVRLSDGDFFGEIAVLRKATRSADIVALSHCRLLLLDAEDLHHLMNRKPGIAAHIRQVARSRIEREALTPRGDITQDELHEREAEDAPP
ncbi:cyclic nucleotide-gated ion channel [Prosthecomicrobium sp. N25]|uniref:cyclic nucleotide-gated ion channel n=1 Tax=Prosthecomicrobium sp. N25 TaxID=3129254 RepID=UPI0030788DBF